MEENERSMIEFMKACPTIPNNKRCWGTPYTGKCPCGGTIYAHRSIRNGYYRAHCDRCNRGMYDN